MSGGLSFNVKGLESAISRFEKLKQSLSNKDREFLDKLGRLGMDTAKVIFKGADYDGNNDVTVGIEWVSDTEIKVVAKGTSVLFIEFGSGMMGYGHPLANDFGYGPGTWSDGPQGKHHWTNPPWIYRGVEGAKNSNYGGAVSGKPGRYWSYGNPPARAMYEAAKEMREKITDIAREVYLS